MTALDDPDVGLDDPISMDGDDTPKIFTPPTVADMGPVNPDTEGLQRRLFGFYKPHQRGINVWKLADGTYTQDQPWPLVTPQDAKEGVLPIGTTATAVTYLIVYYGGHSYQVSDAEAAALTAAGYGSNLT